MRAIESVIRKPIAVGMLIPFIFFLIIGSILIFNGQYRYREIQPDEAIQVSATYKDFSLSKVQRKKQQIQLNFTDHDSLTINPVCISSELENDLRRLPVGCRLEMLIHPDSNTVISIKADNKDILSFDSMLNHFKRSRTVLLFAGIMFYVCGIILTVKTNLRRKKFMQYDNYNTTEY